MSDSEGGVARLLFAWKGSVYKLIWLDVLLFGLGYALLSILYRAAVHYDYSVARESFEIVCVFADRFGGLIPVAFLTGFYVSQVVARWWDQFISLPWPEKMAFKLVAFLPGKDKYRRHLRRTLMRYVNLTSVLSYRIVSTVVKDRFPDYNSLVEANLLLSKEAKRLERYEQLAMPYECTCAPIAWALYMLEKARVEGKIQIEAPLFATLVTNFDYIQDCNRKMLNYDWMKFPLAYTQVAKWAVGIYFFAALFGRQLLTPRAEGLDATMFPNISITYSNNSPFNNHTPDLFVPIFTFVELLCYMGWVKVAGALLNPFGDDDQDFQVNYLIDRNVKISYQIVDEGCEGENEEELEDMEDEDRMEKKLKVFASEAWDNTFSSKALNMIR